MLLIDSSCVISSCDVLSSLSVCPGLLDITMFLPKRHMHYSVSVFNFLCNTDPFKLLQSFNFKSADDMQWKATVRPPVVIQRDTRMAVNSQRMHPVMPWRW